MQVTIRKATIDDAQSIAEVRTGSWQSTYSGILNDAYLNNIDTAKNAELWKQIIVRNLLVYVAETDKIVGFVSGGKNRSSDIAAEGEIYALYLLKEWQGKGIGKMLFDTFINQLLLASMRSMLIWVLRDNPSKHFYIKMGGTFIKEVEMEIGEEKLIEQAYVWDDISQL
jgi:ribosomal protein S18 acetylase RimI-like enzyme